MGKIALENSISFFGAALDALDIEEAVSIKRLYVEGLSSGKTQQADLRDPYALFRIITGSRIKEFGHKNVGRFLVDSWLTPKPQLTDISLIHEESYNQFLRNDGFRVFAELLKDFVNAHVFPQVPGMIGVDHSLTGGVLMALSKIFGYENLGVLVFDVHTDAIPLAIRSGLVEYASEVELPSPGPIAKSLTFDPYTTGNFLFHLIERKIILPKNLIIIGVGDSPDRLRNSNDKRVMEYVRHYDSLLKKGVKIISKDQLRQFGAATIHNHLDQLECSNLYVSLDVDVSAKRGVLATRFIDPVGTETSIILDAALKVAELLSLNRFSLVGLDIMEIDIHKIGAKLRSGIEDSTRDFIEEFLSIFICRLSSKSN